MFYPDTTDHAMRDMALKVCASCPVRSECQDEGRSQRELGIWGETYRERRRALSAAMHAARRARDVS
jgi:hypothetical protein